MTTMKTGRTMGLTLSMATLAVAQEFTHDKKNIGCNETDYPPFVDQHYPN